MSSRQGNEGPSDSGQQPVSGTGQPTRQTPSGTTSTSAAAPTQRRPASSVGAQDTSQTSGYERGTSDTSYSRGTEAGYREETRGSTAAYTGSLLAATLMILTGLLAFFAGLSAIVQRSYYTTVHHGLSHYTYEWNIRGWGWALLILGVLVFAAGACVMLGMTWARMVGIGLAVLTAIGAFMWLPYSPVWAIILVALSVFCIWALARQSIDEADAAY
jgi:hypothetical protein